jgi:hypothetical protein
VNTQRVNGAAGVILAALEQNRTPAGIALALESAGLLMTPETAADMASVSTDAVGVAERAVEELKREHAESARLRARLAERVVAPAPAPGAFRIVVDLENADDYDDAVYAAEQVQGALRGQGYKSVAVVDTEGERQLAALRARVAELEALKPAPIQTCRACGAGYTYGEPCSTCEFRARMAAEVDGITRRIAPTQALREEGACSECGDAPSQWCTGCAKCSCVAEHDLGCAGSAP